MALGDKSYGLLMGTGFFARPSSNQSVTSTTALINFGTVDWTSGQFASSRFTSTMNGIYQIKFKVKMATNNSASTTYRLRKNGVDFYTETNSANGIGFTYMEVVNTSGDYWELFITTAAADILSSTTYDTYFGMKQIG